MSEIKTWQELQEDDEMKLSISEYMEIEIDELRAKVKEFQERELGWVKAQMIALDKDRELLAQALEALKTCEYYDDGGFGHPIYDPALVIAAIAALEERLKA